MPAASSGALLTQKKKTLYIVTAFIGEKGYKNGDTLSFDDKIPEATPKSATASSPTTNIPTANKNVNKQFSVSRRDLTSCGGRMRS